MREKRGRIVSVAPVVVFKARANMQLMRSRKARSRRYRLARRGSARRGVVVNAIAPSTIDTEANRAAMPKAKHENWVKPEESRHDRVLCSEDSRVTAGAVIPVYGRA